MCILNHLEKDPRAFIGYLDIILIDFGLSMVVGLLGEALVVLTRFLMGDQ